MLVPNTPPSNLPRSSRDSEQLSKGASLVDARGLPSDGGYASGGLLSLTMEAFQRSTGSRRSSNSLKSCPSFGTHAKGRELPERTER